MLQKKVVNAVRRHTMHIMDKRSEGSLMRQKNKLFSLLMFPAFFSQISLAASSAVKALERTEQILPHVVQDGLNDHLHKFTSSLQSLELNSFFLKGNLQSHATGCSSHPDTESIESQTG